MQRLVFTACGQKQESVKTQKGAAPRPWLLTDEGETETSDGFPTCLSQREE